MCPGPSGPCAEDAHSVTAGGDSTTGGGATVETDDATMAHAPDTAEARSRDDFTSLARKLRIYADASGDGEQSNQDRLADLAWEFADLFETDPRIVLANSSVKHHIRTGDAAPIRSRRYRRSDHERKIIARHVEKMLADGAIRRERSPWAAQVVLARKPDGSWRFC